MPVDFRGDEERFREGMKYLPKMAAALQEVGVTRTNTYLLPYHDSLTYLSNFKRHANRLREIMKVLADYGLRLGLE